MKKAIVTGSTGFIGSWLVQELLESNYEVEVVARNKDKLVPESRKRCSIIEKSLEELRPEYFDGGADVFFHLAWAGVSSESKNQLDLQLENISVSLNALEIANRIGCKLFVATGTVAEYALCDNVMDMAARQTPNDFYGAAKVSAH